MFNNEHQQWDLKYCCWGLVRQLDFRQEASVSNCVSIRARIATGISICPFKIENYGNGLVRHDARDTHSLHSTYTYRTYYRYCLYHRAIQYSTGTVCTEEEWNLMMERSFKPIPLFYPSFSFFQVVSIR